MSAQDHARCDESYKAYRTGQAMHGMEPTLRLSMEPASESPEPRTTVDTRPTDSELATQSSNTQGLYDFSAVQTW